MIYIPYWAYTGAAQFNDEVDFTIDSTLTTDVINSGIRNSVIAQVLSRYSTTITAADITIYGGMV